jgi:hypothetical protein
MLGESVGKCIACGRDIRRCVPLIMGVYEQGAFYAYDFWRGNSDFYHPLAGTRRTVPLCPGHGKMVYKDVRTGVYHIV